MLGMRRQRRNQNGESEGDFPEHGFGQHQSYYSLSPVPSEYGACTEFLNGSKMVP